MITTDDILDALSKSAAYDAQHTPRTSKILIAAWEEHFTKYAPAITRRDLLDAVTEYHREPHDRMLQPADLSSITRAMRRDRFERSYHDSPERLALESRCDTKAQPGSTLLPTMPNRPSTSEQEHRERLARVIASLGSDLDDVDAKAAAYLRNLRNCAHPSSFEAAEKQQANK